MMQSVVQNSGCNHWHYIRFHGLELQLVTRNQGDRLQPAAMYACQRAAGATGVLHEARKEGGQIISGRIKRQTPISAAQTRNGYYPKLYGLYEQTNATAPDRYMSPEGLATRGR